MFALGPLIMGVISLLAWLIVGGGLPRAAQRLEYVIPAGTAARVKAGGNLDTIPDHAVFVVGDQLVFHNEDNVTHEIGPFRVPAQTTATVTLRDAVYNNYACSVHPSNTISLEVRAPSSLLWTMLPTVVLGVPIGLGLAVITRVMARL